MKKMEALKMEKKKAGKVKIYGTGPADKSEPRGITELIKGFTVLMHGERGYQHGIEWQNWKTNISPVKEMTDKNSRINSNGTKKSKGGDLE
jgi:hypothetical protein